MISVFILEDNERKLQDIIDCLKDKFNDNIKIRSGSYFNESINKLIEEDFDYAILDNNVPRFSDSFDLVQNAAENAMSWLELMDVSTKCIVCSSDEVKFEEEHNNCLGVIKYSSISLDWAKKLKDYVK